MTVSLDAPGQRSRTLLIALDPIFQTFDHATTAYKGRVALVQHATQSRFAFLETRYRIVAPHAFQIVGVEANRFKNVHESHGAFPTRVPIIRLLLYSAGNLPCSFDSFGASGHLKFNHLQEEPVKIGAAVISAPDTTTYYSDDRYDDSGFVRCERCQGQATRRRLF